MTDKTDKTQAIVLTSTPINDHTQFVHLYTERFGRVTCRVPIGARGKKASQMRTMMTPMTVLDLVLGGRPNDNIRQISEAQVIRSPYMLTLTHPDKSAQCLYMAELIAHTVREEESDPKLWQYIVSSLDVLELCQEGWANFHLIFTRDLTVLLGYSIDTEDYTEGCLFDLREAAFTRGPIPHPYYFNAESTKWFRRLLETGYSEMNELKLNRQERAALLDMELAYLDQHISEMGQLKSIEVLKTLFD